MKKKHEVKAWTMTCRRWNIKEKRQKADDDLDDEIFKKKKADDDLDDEVSTKKAPKKDAKKPAVQADPEEDDDL